MNQAKKKVFLTESDLIWVSPIQASTSPDPDTGFVRTRRTGVFKLPAWARSVEKIELRKAKGGKPIVLYDISEIEESFATFLLADGGRANFQRRYFAGEQIGAQLMIRDCTLMIPEVFSWAVTLRLDA